MPRTAPSLALALEEEVHWLDQQEGSLPESVIQDYMFRALELAGDVERALGARKRDLVREMAVISEAEERLGEITRDEGRARSAS